MKRYKIRPGITKFSVIYPYWTHLTYDKEDWGSDLVEHALYGNPEDPEDVMMRGDGDSGYIGFGIEVNSLKELDILEEYFKNIPELSKTSRKIYCQDRKTRIWFTPDNEHPWTEDGELGGVLFIHPLRWGDYQTLREALCDLWKIGFLMTYKEDLMLY